MFSDINTKNPINSPNLTKTSESSIGKIYDQKDTQFTNTSTQETINLSDGKFNFLFL